MYRLFESPQQAEKYAKFRPVHSPEVLQRIILYMSQSDALFETALDIGCGTGQSTFNMRNHFKTVIGTDISEAQINQARTTLSERYGTDEKMMSFRVSPAEDLSFQPDSSVDLVTVAQAIHWIDIEKFYPEVKRVLRPHGVLALYGYGIAYLDDETASNLTHKLFKDIVGNDKDDPRRHILNHCEEYMPLPFSDPCREDDLVMAKQMALGDFLGYLSSSATYSTFAKAHPDTTVLTDLAQSLAEAYRAGPSGQAIIGIKDEDIPTTVTWPIFILMGRNTPAATP